MKPNQRMWICAVVLVAALTGCALFGVLAEPPQVSLASIRVQEIKGFETIFQVDLRVLNRSDRPLSIEGIDCDLALNKRHLARGVAQPGQSIAPFASEIVSVTVYSSMVDMIHVAHRMIQAAQRETPDEKWSYALAGRLHLGGAGIPGKVPFDIGGEIDLKKMVGAEP